MTRIFVYSAIKIRANDLLLYSILNPETNSDSPSDRSKGVRLVSAKRVTNQSIAIGKIVSAGIDFSERGRDPSLNVWVMQIAERRIRAILIS